MPVTEYLWDELSDNVLLEKDGSGTTAARYSGKPGLYGSVVSQNRQGTKSYYHFDSQGSTRELTDSNEGTTDKYTYTAFGTIVTTDGPTETPYQYGGAAGYAQCPGSDTYVRRRSYSSGLGRWLQVDPVDGWREPYVYVSNRPVIKQDPSGEYVFDSVPPNDCSAKEKGCIDIVMEEIRKILSWNDGIHCFTPLRREPRDCTPCRTDVAGCIISTISSKIVIRCRFNPGKKANAVTSGACVESKDEARKTRAGATGCQACSPELLEKSVITFYVGKTLPRHGCSPINRQRLLPSLQELQRLRDFARTVVHELAHQCVGGHLDKPGIDIHGRPDAATIAGDFIRNCWTSKV